LLLGAGSISVGVLAFILGYFVLPGTFSKDLIETIYTLTIESIPVGLFAVGSLSSFVGIIRKNEKFGGGFSLFINIVPLMILLYIVSE